VAFNPGDDRSGATGNSGPGNGGRDDVGQELMATGRGIFDSARAT